MTRDVVLRDVREDDLEIFYEQQLDPAANHMAAFTAKDPADRTAFAKHWSKILGDETIGKKSILFEGQVAGHVTGFEQFGKESVSYWIGREFWGKGIATGLFHCSLTNRRRAPSTPAPPRTTSALSGC